jgi:hypothetical protein
MTSERFGARPVEERGDLMPLGTIGTTTIALTDEELATVVRRRRAKAHPHLWRIGGSLSTDGHTIYHGERFVGMTINPADAAWFVTLANDAVARGDR